MDYLSTGLPHESPKTLQVYDYIRNRSRIETISYLRFFASNLDMQGDDQREATVTYLLSILRDGDKNILLLCKKWKIYEQVGQFLNSEEGLMRLFKTIKGRLYDFGRTDREDDAEDIFLTIVHSQILLPKMDSDKLQLIAAKLRKWSGHGKAHAWADYLEIPF